MSISIYADGGVILKNPSVHGGTYAFVIVGDSVGEIHRSSGVVTPEQVGLPTVTNNYTELLACVNAMRHVEEGWSGTIFTDNFVTLCRLTGKRPKMNGIPEDAQDRMWQARKRLGSFKAVLLDGHPTKDQLFRGRGKRGNPVSKWNVLCDSLCEGRAREFLAKLVAKPVSVS